jgi:[Skp1-protein]-hydroxyproline N-acetylglucosaminyltransferase
MLPSSKIGSSHDSIGSNNSISKQNNGYHNHNNNSNSHRRDRPVAIALAVMLLIYMSVTVIAYIRVSAVDDPQQQRQRQQLQLQLQEGGSLGSILLRRGGAVIGNTISPLSVLSQSSQSAADMITNNDPIERYKHNFPYHVAYPRDIESIPHPGLMLVKDHNKIPDDLPRNVTVPKFYAEIPSVVQAYGGTTSVRNVLGDNGRMLITKEQAMSIGSFTTSTTTDGKQQQQLLETIYCSVASYRDPECTGTVEDLYARSDHPERIRVAIIDQVSAGDNDCHRPAVPCEQDPSQMLCVYAHLIDYYPMDARMGVGPVFARHLAHRHYRGEYFAMQIDSHVRFIQHWDADIVSQWKSAKNEMAVLTTYLSDITDSIDPATHTSRHPGRPIMCQSDFEGSGQYKHLRHGQQPEGIPGITGQPTLHPFWAAGFSFARGHFVMQIPYDQYLPMVFQGEEISIGLRAFTYGYDFYTRTFLCARCSCLFG